jgi:ankyrin repeat protein
VHQITPLHWAVFAGNTEVAALLIQEGADVNARDVNQKTPLHWAASRGMTEVAALLIEKGADVNALNGKH